MNRETHTLSRTDTHMLAIYMLRMVLWRLIAHCSARMLVFVWFLCEFLCLFLSYFILRLFACVFFWFASCLFHFSFHSVLLVAFCWFIPHKMNSYVWNWMCARTRSLAWLPRTYTANCECVLFAVCALILMRVCLLVSLAWMLSVAYIFGVTTLTVQPNVCVYIFVRTFNRSLPFLGISLSFLPLGSFVWSFGRSDSLFFFIICFCYTYVRARAPAWARSRTAMCVCIHIVTCSLSLYRLCARGLRFHRAAVASPSKMKVNLLLAEMKCPKQNIEAAFGIAFALCAQFLLGLSACCARAVDWCVLFVRLFVCLFASFSFCVLWQTVSFVPQFSRYHISGILYWCFMFKCGSIILMAPFVYHYVINV